MTQNCQWFGSKLDAYFEEKLGRSELHAFEEHRTACPECGRKVVELDNELSTADPVLREVLRYRMIQAQKVVQWNSRSRVWRLAFAGSGLAVAGLLTLMLVSREPAPPPTIAVQPSVPEESATAPPIKTEKSEDAVDGIQRAKPEAGRAPPAAPRDTVVTTADSPEFAIIDAAGYSASLSTYRGKVLLFAVVSPEDSEVVRNLQGLYATFGANPDLRVLGIATDRDATLTGFPVFYNQGSKLLGVEEGQFLLADGAGKAVLRGPLTEANAGRVRAQLVQLGIR